VSLLDFKVQPISIDSDDPFKFDLLGRKEEILNLNQLVANLDSASVLSIDSRWGTGKTTFIKLWMQHLINSQSPCLYFNAWETDFSSEPLVSFLGEMNQGLEKLIGASSVSTDAWEKAKSAGKQLAKHGIPALIRIGTAGVIDAEKFIEDELVKTAGKLASDAVENYLKEKAAIAEFKSALSTFVQSSTDENKLVVFVDELDRCRPLYAIELLERIKHIFNVDGIVFVLALDKEQLCHSIQAVYGSEFDSTGYLRRFVDFEYLLKKPDISSFVDVAFSSIKIDEFFAPRMQHRELRYEQEHLVNVFKMLANGLNMSLREIEQFIASINIAIRTAASNEYIFPALLVFLIVARSNKPETYNRYVSKGGNEDELIEYLYEINPLNKRNESFECALVEGFLIAAKHSRSSSSSSGRLQKYKSMLGDEHFSIVERQYSETVINVVNRPSGSIGGISLNSVKDRVEWLSQFKFSYG
jgi:hypothetical protein